MQMERECSHSKIRVKRIAVFRALQLGDMLCVVPAIRAIKQQFPESEITLIGLPWQKYFVERFSHYFTAFVEFPGWPGLPERACNIPDVMDFLKRMHDEKFDLVIQMQGNGYIVNPMCMMFGALHVAGLRREDDYCPEEGLFPVMEEQEHEILRFMKLAAALGAPATDTSLEFPVLPGEEQRALQILSRMGLKPGKYVCVHPGARDPRRRWNPEYFGRVADALASRGYQILLTGSEEEKSILAELTASMHTPAFDLVKQFGHLGIGELAALFRTSAGLVSNDTGVSHVASALNVRSVVIFSPYSDPGRWKPLNGHLHKAILPDEAVNVMYVVNTVLRHLDLGVESNQPELV